MSKAFEASLDTKNFAIIDGYAKAVSVLSRSHTPLCSISGGSDSDIVLDVIHNVDEKKKVRYFWIDTGLEYRATKEHLDDLERKYGIEIERIKACKPIPFCCKEYGQPFLPNTSANRSCGYSSMDSNGKTSRYRNCWSNIRTARSPCNGGVMLITPRKMESSK